MSADLIPMIHWDAKLIEIDYGRGAGMVPIAPPGDIVPAGYRPGESLEWGVAIENLPRLLRSFDVYLTRKDGSLYGYVNEKGNGFDRCDN